MTPLLEKFLEPFVAGVGLTLMAGFTALVRSYFDRIHKDVSCLTGRLDQIQTTLGENTKEIAVTRQEVKALWRYVDGGFNRASDRIREEPT